MAQKGKGSTGDDRRSEWENEHMTKITYIDTTGKHHEVEAGSAVTVMQAAREHDVPGITADCGGTCACGTCHVIVSPEWVDRLPAAGDVELLMLEFALNREKNSRLSCQIKVDPSLDGLVVHVASDQ
jgi:2Fe-2S ferredoxin